MIHNSVIILLPGSSCQQEVRLPHLYKIKALRGCKHFTFCSKKIICELLFPKSENFHSCFFIIHLFIFLNLRKSFCVWLSLPTESEAFRPGDEADRQHWARSGFCSAVGIFTPTTNSTSQKKKKCKNDISPSAKSRAAATKQAMK